MNEFSEAMDLAQSMVTRLLHGDRADVCDELMELSPPEHTRILLVLLDLTCYVHTRWATAVGMTTEQRDQAWAEMMVDVAVWREGVGL